MYRPKVKRPAEKKKCVTDLLLSLSSENINSEVTHTQTHIRPIKPDRTELL